MADPVVWPYEPDYQGGLVERYGYLTEIIEAYDGTEQRIQMRRHPVGGIEFSSFFQLLQDAQKAMVLLERNQAEPWIVPLWPYLCELTANAPAGATSLSCNPVDAPFLNPLGLGRYAVLWSSPGLYELVEVDTVFSASVTIHTPLANSFSSGQAWLIPARRALLLEATNIPRITGTVWGVRLNFSFDAAQDENSVFVGSTGFVIIGTAVLPIP